MKKFYIVALATLSLVACQKKENVQTESGLVKISPVLTKVNDTNFESGDKIGLNIDLAGSNYATNAALTYTDGAFAGTLKWYSEALTTSTLTAYYPYSESGIPATFTVADDQTAGLSASDFVAGKKENVTPSANAIVVPFKHLLSKIVVAMENESGADITGVELLGSKITAAVDVNALSASADEASEVQAIKLFTATSGSLYSAIVVPQTVAFELKVTTSTGSVLTQKLVSTELAQGGQYTINVKVLPAEIKVTISGDIENWDDKGEIGQDIPTYIDFAEYDGYFVYKNEKYNTVSLPDGSVWMAQPMRYVPSEYTVSTGPVTDESAVLWDPEAKYGSVAKAKELGWNHAFSGMRQKATFSASGVYQKTAIAAANTNDESIVGMPGLSYYASSTYYNSKADSNRQFFAMMTTYTGSYKDGRLSVAFAHYESGVQLRCIKNK